MTDETITLTIECDKCHKILFEGNPTALLIEQDKELCSSHKCAITK